MWFSFGLGLPDTYSHFRAHFRAQHGKQWGPAEQWHSYKAEERAGRAWTLQGVENRCQPAALEKWALGAHVQNIQWGCQTAERERVCLRGWAQSKKELMLESALKQDVDMKVNGKEEGCGVEVHRVVARMALDGVRESVSPLPAGARTATGSKACPRVTRDGHGQRRERGVDTVRKGFNTHTSLQWVGAQEGAGDGGSLWEAEGRQTAQGT